MLPNDRLPPLSGGRLPAAEKGVYFTQLETHHEKFA